MLVAGPAAARPFDDGGASNQSAVEEQSSQTTPWYLTDQYRSFMLPADEANRIVNQRQLELAADRSAQRAEQVASAGEQIGHARARSVMRRRPTPALGPAPLPTARASGPVIV